MNNAILFLQSILHAKADLAYTAQESSAYILFKKNLETIYDGLIDLIKTPKPNHKAFHDTVNQLRTLCEKYPPQEVAAQSQEMAADLSPTAYHYQWRVWQMRFIYILCLRYRKDLFAQLETTDKLEGQPIGALYQKAQCHEYGVDGPKDLKMAMDLYRKLATAGHVASQSKLAELMKTNVEFVIEDEGESPKERTEIEENIQLLKKAAHSDPEALYYLAQVWDQDIELPDYTYFHELTKSRRIVGMSSLQVGSLKEHTLFNMFMIAAEEHYHAKSVFMLGWCYENGLAGLVADFEKAVDYYQIALRGPIKDPKAEFRLASFYMAGFKHLPRDTKKALQLLEAASDAGLLEASLLLGVCYTTGTHVLKVQHGKSLCTKWDTAYGPVIEKNRTCNQGLLDKGQWNETAILNHLQDSEPLLAFKYTKFLEKMGQNSSPFYKVLGIFSNSIQQLTKLYNSKEHLKGQKNDKVWLPFIKLFEKLKVLKFVAAIYCLADLQEKVFSNMKESMENYTYAAKLGCSASQNRLGLHYKREKNADSAFFFFKLAADQLHPEALFQMGLCLEQGFGVKQNLTVAIQYYNQAIQQGHKEAELNLAALYEVEWEHGRVGIIELQRAFEIYQAHHNLVKKAGGKRQSEQEENLSQKTQFLALKIALYCELGQKGFFRNVSNAASYYQIAADLGSHEARNKLGFFYEKGIGVKKDWVIAIRFYNEALPLMDAQLNLARCREYGIGVAIDLADAFTRYTYLANQNYPGALLALGRLHEEGKAGLKADPLRAMEFYHKAADKGLAEAEFVLGERYQQGAYVFSEAKLFKEQSQLDKEALQRMKDLPEGLKHLAKTGLSKEKNLAEAIRHYQKASKLGNLNAKMKLAGSYFHGLFGEDNFEQSYFKALGYLEEILKHDQFVRSADTEQAACESMYHKITSSNLIRFYTQLTGFFKENNIIAADQISVLIADYACGTEDISADREKARERERLRARHGKCLVM